jgi:hypothetical protein
MLSQNIGITLKLILELSNVGCQLNSSSSVLSTSEGTTVPTRTLPSLGDFEVATQIVFQNLKSAAAH